MAERFSSNNPYEILARPKDWVQWEYENGIGSRAGLFDYAKRQRLLHNINESSLVPSVVKEALRYLLGEEN